jgi:hypothetical protein
VQQCRGCSCPSAQPLHCRHQLGVVIRLRTAADATLFARPCQPCERPFPNLLPLQLLTAECPFANLPERGRKGALDAQQMKEAVWVLCRMRHSTHNVEAGLCRMASAGVAITALNATLFGMISLSFPAQEHRLPFHW